MAKLAMFIGFAVLVIVVIAGVYKLATSISINRSEKSEGDKE